MEVSRKITDFYGPWLPSPAMFDDTGGFLKMYHVNIFSLEQVLNSKSSPKSSTPLKKYEFVSWDDDIPN